MARGVSSLWIFHEETIELIRRYRDGDSKAYDMLIKSFQTLVISLARKYKKAGLLLEDMIQEGNIGLIKAVDLFDESHNRSFINYAKHWVFQALISFRMNHSTMIRIPYNLLHFHRKMQRLKEKYEQESMSLVSAGDIDWGDDLSEEKVKLLKNFPDDFSEQLVYSTYEEFETDEDYMTDTKLHRESLEVGVRRLLQSLSIRERQIMMDLFGLNGTQPKTLEEIGQKHNLTRERVRQIKEKAIRKLRDALFAFRMNKKEKPAILERIRRKIEKLKKEDREAKYTTHNSTKQFARPIVIKKAEGHNAFNRKDYSIKTNNRPALFENKRLQDRPIKNNAPKGTMGPNVSRKSRISEISQTVLATMNLFEQGLTPAQIAAERNLGVGTILTHLATLISLHKIDIHDVLEPSTIQIIENAIQKCMSDRLSEIKQLCPKFIGYEDIKMVLCYHQSKKQLDHDI